MVLAAAVFLMPVYILANLSVRNHSDQSSPLLPTREATTSRTSSMPGSPPAWARRCSRPATSSWRACSLLVVIVGAGELSAGARHLAFLADHLHPVHDRAAASLSADLHSALPELQLDGAAGALGAAGADHLLHRPPSALLDLSVHVLPAGHPDRLRRRGGDRWLRAACRCSGTCFSRCSDR